MELREYAAVLTRRWRWLAACLLGSLALAAVAVLVSPKTWTADTQVFVSSTQDSTSPSFLQQRVKSYPDIATSAEVLEPVRATLGLDMSLSALRATVSTENPVDTSQINISVTDSDPDRAADIADAVADEFSSAVERLETTGSGTSPVTLTVTNPATVPTEPTSPQVVLLLALGLVCGLGTGVAAAVVRDRLDTRVWTPEDVRAAWGASVPDVLSTRSRREPADRAAQVLARRIERRAVSGPVRVLLVAPTERGTAAVTALTDDLTDVLTRRGVVVGTAATAPVADPPEPDAPDAESAPAAAHPEVEFATLPPDAALSTWRTEVAASDGVVVVCPSGSADRVDVFELGQLLDGVEATVVGVVFPPAGKPRRSRRPAVVEDVVVTSPSGPEGSPGRPAAPPRPTLGRRPFVEDNSWARLTSEGPAAEAPAEQGAPAVDRAVRPVLARVEPAPSRSNRVAGSSRRVSASSRRPTGRLTVRIPPDAW